MRHWLALLAVVAIGGAASCYGAEPASRST